MVRRGTDALVALPTDPRQRLQQGLGVHDQVSHPVGQDGIQIQRGWLHVHRNAPLPAVYAPQELEVQEDDSTPACVQDEGSVWFPCQAMASAAESVIDRND